MQDYGRREEDPPDRQLIDPGARKTPEKIGEDGTPPAISSWPLPAKFLERAR